MTYYRHVDGKEKAKITLYTLSTCGWCRKTKALLNELGLAYNYVDMDLIFDDDKREEAKEMLKKWNPTTNLPPRPFPPET